MKALPRLAAPPGKGSAVAWFGSLKHMAERLLESVGKLYGPDEG